MNASGDIKAVGANWCSKYETERHEVLGTEAGDLGAMEGPERRVCIQTYRDLRGPSCIGGVEKSGVSQDPRIWRLGAPETGPPCQR